MFLTNDFYSKSAVEIVLKHCLPDNQTQQKMNCLSVTGERRGSQCVKTFLKKLSIDNYLEIKSE